MSGTTPTENGPPETAGGTPVRADGQDARTADTASPGAVGSLAMPEPAARTGRRHERLLAALGHLLFVLMLAGTIGLGYRLLTTLSDAPRTSDAEIDAEVVRIAAAVPGRLQALRVADGERVDAGQVLFRIAAESYRQELALAEAELAAVQAQLAEQERLLQSERANATAARDEVSRARANLELANRSLARTRAMAADGYASQQALDEARTAVGDAEVSLRQALEGARAAESEVQTARALKAQVRANEALVAIARRELEKTAVRAPIAGRVAGLRLAEGEFLQPGEPLFTLIDTASWHARALFRETDLKHLRVGDPARVYVMIDQSRPIAGEVAEIGWGVVSDDAIGALGDLPYVARTLNWVRVAARFPVRIALTDPPERLMRIGASAVVQVDERR
ncbi:multidrug transporter subunit MdtN [uncultured Thiohalocapsa sp.]|uniref:multidrug transporter subunit MdtN n=1 Tax=uncultured Thiohalocapsa sp. TaxID=768990 RepID=UPI0025EDCBB9|nr:multidrug transporter subunit MdtN [uncultured Thiohalocapsa sp.]